MKHWSSEQRGGGKLSRFYGKLSRFLKIVNSPGLILCLPEVNVKTLPGQNYVYLK